MNNSNASGKEFVDHWEWAAEKGVMKKNTARAFKAAVVQILSVIDDWETKSIVDLDVDDAIMRFQNLRAREFKPITLEAYKRRFKQAVDSFLQYKKDPSGWKPATRKRSSRKLDNSKVKNVTPPNSSNDNGKDKVNSTPPTPSENLVEYPFPLRENLVAYLRLPSDLKIAEAKRVYAFMTTLALDYEPNDI